MWWHSKSRSPRLGKSPSRRFQDQCPLTEAGILIHIPDMPQASPDRAGTNRVGVSIQGYTYQALVDLACNQTTDHQNLIRELGNAKLVKVIVHEFPLMPVQIKFRGGGGCILRRWWLEQFWSSRPTGRSDLCGLKKGQCCMVSGLPLRPQAGASSTS